MEEMLIKYNEKYDRWCRSDGKIYRQTKDGEFIECKQSKLKSGYLRITIMKKQIFSHRLIWETLKGQITPGYEIDHINAIRDDNRLENLRCGTHSYNMNNIITKEKMSKTISSVMKGNTNTRNKPHSNSDFGNKYFEHYGYGKYKNKKQYCRECNWYHTHNKKCSWEE